MRLNLSLEEHIDLGRQLAFLHDASISLSVWCSRAMGSSARISKQYHRVQTARGWLSRLRSSLDDAVFDQFRGQRTTFDISRVYYPPCRQHAIDSSADALALARRCEEVAHTCLQTVTKVCGKQLANYMLKVYQDLELAYARLEVYVQFGTK